MKGFKLKYSRPVQYWRDSATLKQVGLDVAEINGVVYFTPIRTDGLLPTIKVAIPLEDIPDLIQAFAKNR